MTDAFADTAPPVEGTFLTLAAGNSPMAIIPSRLADVVDMAAAIFASGLAPDSFKNQDQVTVAILKGLELGLPPLQALESIAVINGRAGIWGDVGLALILRSGLLEAFDEGYRGEGDAHEAWITMKRKGLPSMTKTFSVADAKVARLWEGVGIPAGDKRERSPWVRHPDVMLLWRARWRLWRALFTDVMKNMPGAEELQGEVIDVSPNVPPKPPTVDIATRLANGKKPEATFTGSEKAPNLPQESEEASAGITLEGTARVATGASASPPAQATADAGPLFKAQDPSRFDFALVAEIEEALSKAKLPVEVVMLADEYAGALQAAQPETRTKVELLMSVRKAGLEQPS